jgi:hypothetical protein
VSFVRVPDLRGKLYVPEYCRGASQKKTCRDCFCCQNCSEARCGMCRGSASGESEQMEEYHETHIMPE